MKQELLYTPYGDTFVDLGSADIERYFTGQIKDKESGLMYYNNRYYDSELGTFTRPDPAMDGVNHYGYVNGNPVKYNDPTGLLPGHNGDPEWGPDRKSRRKSTPSPKKKESGIGEAYYPPDPIEAPEPTVDPDTDGYLDPYTSENPAPGSDVADRERENQLEEVEQTVEDFVDKEEVQGDESDGDGDGDQPENNRKGKRLERKVTRLIGRAYVKLLNLAYKLSGDEQYRELRRKHQKNIRQGKQLKLKYTLDNPLDVFREIIYALDLLPLTLFATYVPDLASKGLLIGLNVIFDLGVAWLGRPGFEGNSTTAGYSISQYLGNFSSLGSYFMPNTPSLILGLIGETISYLGTHIVYE